LLWLLGLTLDLRGVRCWLDLLSIVQALHSWRLLTLGLLRLLLLAWMGSPLLWKSLRGRGPLNISAHRLRRLCALGRWSVSRDRRWWAGDALVLRGTSVLRHSLPCLWGGRGRTLHRLGLVVLSHYVVLRLVSIVLGLERLLLLHAGISIPRILSLIYGQRGGRWYGATIPLVPSVTTLFP
jgi:hypothetical protein